jgi:hypothetical protein
VTEFKTEELLKLLKKESVDSSELIFILFPNSELEVSGELSEKKPVLLQGSTAN